MICADALLTRQYTITAAAIDDVLGWILLGAVVSMATHGKADLSSLALSFAGVALLGMVATHVEQNRL